MHFVVIKEQSEITWLAGFTLFSFFFVCLTKLFLFLCFPHRLNPSNSVTNALTHKNESFALWASIAAQKTSPSAMLYNASLLKKKGKKHDHRPKHQTWSLFLSLSERSSVEALDLCLPWDLFVLAAVVSEETFSHSPARQRAALWLLFTHHYKGLTPSLCALSRSSAASPQCLDPCCSLDWRVDITAYKDWTFVYFLPPFGCFFPLFIHLHLDTSDSLRHWICAHRMMTTPFLPVEVK